MPHILKMLLILALVYLLAMLCLAWLTGDNRRPAFTNEGLGPHGHDSYMMAYSREQTLA